MEKFVPRYKPELEKLIITEKMNVAKINQKDFHIVWDNKIVGEIEENLKTKIFGYGLWC